MPKRSSTPPPRLPTPGVRRANIFTFRVTPDERDAYSAAALNQGLSLSDWFRAVLNREARKKAR